jgi:hypothetical protein
VRIVCDEFLVVTTVFCVLVYRRRPWLLGVEGSCANVKYAAQKYQQQLITRYVSGKEPITPFFKNSECLSNVWEGLLLGEIVGTGLGTLSRSHLTGGLRWEVIINFFLKEQERIIWSGSIRLRMRSCSGYVQSHGNETLASIRAVNFLASWASISLSSEGFCPTVLDMH